MENLTLLENFYNLIWADAILAKPGKVSLVSVNVLKLCVKALYCCTALNFQTCVKALMFNHFSS
jgi:hypothetical protein